jgi:hypothetical protein
MGHRCEVNRHLHGYEATFNLFLTLPNPSQLPKGTRGSLKQGMVGLFASRIRKIVFGDGDLLFCAPVGTKEMHSVFTSVFPDNYVFPSAVPRSGDAAALERVLRSALRTLVGKAVVSPAMNRFLTENVPRRRPLDIREYEISMVQQASWFTPGRQPRAPKPRAKKVFAPKPRARSKFIKLKD